MIIHSWCWSNQSSLRSFLRKWYEMSLLHRKRETSETWMLLCDWVYIWSCRRRWTTREAIIKTIPLTIVNSMIRRLCRELLLVIGILSRRVQETLQEDHSTWFSRIVTRCPETMTVLLEDGLTTNNRMTDLRVAIHLHHQYHFLQTRISRTSLMNYFVRRTCHLRHHGSLHWN